MRCRMACGVAARQVGYRRLPDISGKMLVGMVGYGYLHEVDPQRERGVAAAFFVAQRLTIVVANPHSAGDGGGEADEPCIVEVSGRAGFAPQRVMQRAGLRSRATRLYR